MLLLMMMNVLYAEVMWKVCCIQTHKKIGCIGLACGVELLLEVVSWSDLGRVRQSLRKVRLQSIALILLSKTNVIS